MDVGVDTIEIERIKVAISRYGARFLNRLFTQQEQLYCESKSDPSPFYAVRFAAKEAVYKSLPEAIQKRVFLKDIEVIKTASGKPGIQLSPDKVSEEGVSISISLSHSQSQAVAVSLCMRHNG
jgi:holo-[acyl-carrier protein] synthase